MFREAACQKPKLVLLTIKNNRSVAINGLLEAPKDSISNADNILYKERIYSVIRVIGILICRTPKGIIGLVGCLK